jgi:hypothetical protein
MDIDIMKACEQAKVEIARETKTDEEVVWKILKKIVYMYVTRI